jgi:hypothetical protein
MKRPVYNVEYHNEFFMAQKLLLDEGIFIIAALRSHSDTPHSVGSLWTSDQPDAETSV